MKESSVINLLSTSSLGLKLRTHYPCPRVYLKHAGTDDGTALLAVEALSWRLTTLLGHVDVNTPGQHCS